MPPGFNHPDARITSNVDMWLPAGFAAEPFPEPTRHFRFLDAIVGVRRLKPGISLTAGQTAVQTIADRLKGQEAEAYAPEPQSWSARIRPLDEQVIGGVAPRAPRPPRRGDARPPRRVQQRRQPAAGSRERPPPRDGVSAARSAPRSGGSSPSSSARASSSRSSAASSASSSRSGSISSPRSRRPSSCACAASASTGASSASPPSFLRRRRPALRRDPGGAGLADRPAGGDARRRRGPRRGAAPASPPPAGRRGRAGAGPRPPRRRGLAPAEPLERRQGRPRLPGARNPQRRPRPPQPNKLESGKYYKFEQRDVFFRQLLEKLAAAPGVESAAIILTVPLRGDPSRTQFGIVPEGRETGSGAELKVVQGRFASADYFHTMRVPILAGRGFTDADALKAPKVAIGVRDPGAALLARRVGGGQALRLPQAPSPPTPFTGQPPEDPWVTIVGVVGDVKTSGLNHRRPTRCIGRRRSSTTWI